MLKVDDLIASFFTPLIFAELLAYAVSYLGLTSGNLPSSTARSSIARPINQEKDHLFSSHFVYYFSLVCWIASFSSFIDWNTIDIASYGFSLSPQPEIPHLPSFAFSVFCKVYSGNSEKSEPFSLFYITKNQSKQKTGKNFEKKKDCSFSPYSLHPSTVNLRCVRQSSCVVATPHTLIRYDTSPSSWARFFANFLNSDIFFSLSFPSFQKPN